MTDLGAPLAEGDVRLDPLVEAHRDALRNACGEDRDIWSLYPVSWGKAHFDAAFDALLARPASHPFAIIQDGMLTGMTAFLGHQPERQTVEIGNSYVVPAARGSGLNDRVKRLLLDRAFAFGIRRVEFRVDMRNARSLAALAKLGAQREGVLRAERVTWTGHVRDAALFSILAGEWGR
ncbi:GNAT family N-acetyltransferase [Sphingomonas sp.]|uniref:GNAT family N-acetyltransferase n=1 Tax=Sphingomonas sp. TaxID=28214 RepID=UPI003B3B7D5C